MSYAVEVRFSYAVPGDENLAKLRLSYDLDTVAGRPVGVRSVDPPLSFLARVWSNVRDFVDGTSYLWYLQKNLFKIECPQNSLFNLAAVPNRVHFELIPDGYREEQLRTPGITAQGKKVVFTNDEGLFWQKPDGTPERR